MQIGFISTLTLGWQYSRVWPAKAELNAIFPENKVIFLTKKAAKLLPLLAVLTAVVQFKFLGTDFLGQILAMMLLIISMPIHGWYWLGVRAKTNLPPSLINWGNEIREQMAKNLCGHAVPDVPKSYFDLARLLQLAYQQLDKNVMRRWF